MCAITQRLLERLFSGVAGSSRDSRQSTRSEGSIDDQRSVITDAEKCLTLNQRVGGSIPSRRTKSLVKWKSQASPGVSLPLYSWKREGFRSQSVPNCGVAVIVGWWRSRRCTSRGKCIRCFGSDHSAGGAFSRGCAADPLGGLRGDVTDTVQIDVTLGFRLADRQRAVVCTPQ